MTTRRHTGIKTLVFILYMRQVPMESWHRSWRRTSGDKGGAAMVRCEKKKRCLWSEPFSPKFNIGSDSWHRTACKTLLYEPHTCRPTVLFPHFSFAFTQILQLFTHSIFLYFLWCIQNLLKAMDLLFIPHSSTGIRYLRYLPPGWIWYSSCWCIDICLWSSCQINAFSVTSSECADAN